MIMFKLDRFAPLLEAISMLVRVGEEADLIISPTIFSLKASNPSPRFTAAFLMAPEFFTFFLSDRIHHSRISIDLFYAIMFNMDARGFPSMIFSLGDQRHQAFLTFEGATSRRRPQVLLRQLALLPPRGENVGQIDYETFVSIDSQAFRHVVAELNASYVHITLTDSQVKFSNRAKEIILTQERRQCIIGCPTIGGETQFLISLHPMTFFHDLTYQSGRIWLFKSIDSSSIIIVPVGMYAEFWVYFPQRWSANM